MVDAKKALNAAMILSWEADGMAYDEAFVAALADHLRLGEGDIQAADDAIEAKRDLGGWGGHRRKVISQAVERVTAALEADALPESGGVRDGIDALLKRFSADGDDDAFAAFADEGDASGTEGGDAAPAGEARDGGIGDESDDVDPFEELGVGRSSTGSSGAGPASGSAGGDALDALMAADDDDGSDTDEGAGGDLAATLVGDGDAEDADEDLLAGLAEEFAPESEASADDSDDASDGDSEVAPDTGHDEAEAEAEAEAETSESTEPAIVEEAPDAAEVYTMLLRTVWVDGILDPAEVQLLARKREQLGITFERHLELVREVVG